MSSSGTPPKGEPTPLDVSPSSHPVEPGAVDQDWFDVDLEAQDDEPSANSDDAVARASRNDEKSSDNAVARASKNDEKSSDDAVARASRNDEKSSDSAVARASKNDERSSDNAVARASKDDEKPSDNAVARASKNDAKPSIMPRSLSPVVLANEGRVLSEPPVGPVTPARAEPNKKSDDAVAPSHAPQPSAREEIESAPTSPVGSASIASTKLRLRWIWLAAAALGVAVALPLLHGKRTAPRATATPSARVPEAPAVAASAAIDLPPLVTVAATNAPPPDTTATQSPAPAVASGAADDSFLTAFQRNAAKQDAKWANVKPPPERSNGAVAPAASMQSEAAKVPKPDPMDVLKRLEESRKAKRQ